VGLALGLGAALAWGFADYFAARASRRIGALRVVLGFHLVATAVLLGLVLATGALGDVSVKHVAFFAGVGVLGWSSYLAFYRALAIGPISVASPIISGYAAVTVVLAVLVVGERLSGRQTAAIVVTILGVVLSGADLHRIARLERVAPLGLLFSLLAMVLIGAFVFGISYYRDELGWLAPIFLGRAFATLFLIAHVGRSGWPAADRTPRILAVLVLLALLDTAGYVCFNVGTGYAKTSIVAAASAPYGVVPVIMGVAFLAERPTRPQWVGAALVIAGLVLLGLAGS
jgi:drug/metabolite transporter (DMT)-like permease